MRVRRRAMAWCVRSQSRKARRSPRTGSSRRSSCADRRRLEEMPKALLLRSEVANVRRRGRHLERDAFRYVDAVRAEFLDLRGVVRHQLNRCHAKHSEHARGTLVTPEVRGEAKDAICVDGVETVVFGRERADERVVPEVAVGRREAGLASEENVVAQFAFGTRHEPAVPTVPAYIRMQVRPATR